MAGATDTSTTDGDGTLEEGVVIAERYRLDKPIGHGGMATIWQGTHLTLRTPIAIKFIELIGPRRQRMRERFLREARVAAAVRHRDVVDILDFGTTTDGRPFMVMELLVGQTLAERMTRGPEMSVGDAVNIVARVLSGLAAVHAAKIVHRDLKPENIFLVEHDEGIDPKLLDFGVSRAVGATDLESVMPTMENAIVGTPQYMSPEQARGLPDVDHRSDIWSVGVIMYELLTGKLPYDSQAIGDVIIQIATEDPPDFAELRPDLAGPVDAVVKKAMRRDREERYADAREMRAALLAAVAETAAALAAASTKNEARARIPTGGKPVQARELITAVGNAYEPGDSGLIDLGDLDIVAERREMPSGLRMVPPSPQPTGADPFASEPPETRPASSKTLPWLVLSGFILIGIALVLSSALEPDDTEPRIGRGIQHEETADPMTPIAGEETGPAQAEALRALDDPSVMPPFSTVHLENVPRGSRVYLNGRRVDGTGPFELDEPTRIFVRARWGVWVQQHEGGDATYRVVLRRPRRR